MRTTGRKTILCERCLEPMSIGVEKISGVCGKCCQYLSREKAAANADNGAVVPQDASGAGKRHSGRRNGR